MHKPWSWLGTVRKHSSGIIIFWTVKLPKTLRHTSLNLLRGKTEWSSKSSTITVGFACSEVGSQQPLTWRNSSHYGSGYRASSCNLEYGTPLFGSGQQMEFTQPNQHTAYNSKDPTADSARILFERHMPKTNAKSSLAAKKLATPRPLRDVQRTTGNSPKLVPVVRPGHRSLAPCAEVGTLRCGLNLASGAAI